MEKLKCTLLIDDDNINNFINQRLINRLNLSEQVLIFPNGQEGLKYIKMCDENGNPSPDLILLDINMPVMDGFEFLKAYQDLTFPYKKAIIKVLLTTETTDKDTARLHKLGIAGFIPKPVTEEKLKGVMQEHFGW